MTGLRRFLAIVGLIALLVLAGGTLMLMAGHARYGIWSTGMPFGRPFLMGGYGSAYGPSPTWTYRMERNGFGTYGPGYNSEWGMMGSPRVWGSAMPPGSIGMGLGYRGLSGFMASYDQLDLTAEQEEKLGQLQLDLFQQEAALAAQLYEPDAQLQKLYAAGTTDAATLDPVFAKIAHIQRQMFQVRLVAKTRMEALLKAAPAQQPKDVRPGPGARTP